MVETLKNVAAVIAAGFVIGVAIGAMMLGYRAVTALAGVF